MRKATIIITAFVTIILSCKGNQGTQEKRTIQKSEYPSVIDSLGLKDLYNQTKWLMYCFQCDDTLKTATPGILGDSITFGMLCLKFDTIRTFRDSLTEIKFNFYYKETKINDSFSRNIPIWGVVYADTNKRVIYYSMRSDFGYTNDSCPPRIECKSRFLKPLQPEVIKYINDNKTKINPWFYKEAKRRGVIK